MFNVFGVDEIDGFSLVWYLEVIVEYELWMCFDVVFVDCGFVGQDFYLELFVCNFGVEIVVDDLVMCDGLVWYDLLRLVLVYVNIMGVQFC